MKLFENFWGHQYLVNLHTGEVHDLKNTHKNCNLHLIASYHKKYVTKKKAMKMMKTGNINGCRWCMPKSDTDKW
jgi:hypothetical protein